MSEHHESNGSDGCQHANILEDIETGSTICTDCAFIIDTLPLFGATFEPQQELRTDENHDVLTMVFVDLCFNSNISPIFAQDMAALFKSVIENHQITYLQKSTLIALCFSEVMKRENAPRSLKEISGLTGEPLKSLVALMKEVFPRSIQVQPHQLVGRFCGKLNIHRRHAMQIEKKLTSLIQVNSVSPDTVAAAAITDHVRNNALGIQLQQISEVCGITQVSIRRQLRRLEHLSKP